MLLAINDDRKLADIQEKFNECFPHLKIEFYQHPHHWKEQSNEDEQLDPEKKVGEVSAKHEHGVLEIYSSYQTGRVEHDFHQQFGLNAQIFRFENGTWIQTSESDSLTLGNQQAIAAKIIGQENTETDSMEEAN